MVEGSGIACSGFPGQGRLGYLHQSVIGGSVIGFRGCKGAHSRRPHRYICRRNT